MSITDHILDSAFILLVLIFILTGASIGAASGAATIMRRGEDGGALVRAGWRAGRSERAARRRVLAAA